MGCARRGATGQGPRSNTRAVSVGFSVSPGARSGTRQADLVRPKDVAAQQRRVQGVRQLARGARDGDAEGRARPREPRAADERRRVDRLGRRQRRRLQWVHGRAPPRLRRPKWTKRRMTPPGRAPAPRLRRLLLQPTD